MLDEEIVVFEPPGVYEYRIIPARPFPVKHKLGRVELEALDANSFPVHSGVPFDDPDSG